MSREISLATNFRSTSKTIILNHIGHKLSKEDKKTNILHAKYVSKQNYEDFKVSPQKSNYNIKLISTSSQSLSEVTLI